MKEIFLDDNIDSIKTKYMLVTSDPKNLHCAGARTVPALYGCGPHSNRGFHGH